jgi:hypothetical protein
MGSVMTRWRSRSSSPIVADGGSEQADVNVGPVTPDGRLQRRVDPLVNLHGLPDRGQVLGR